MLMCISLFTPCVFSECLSAGMKGPITSNNSMQQMDNGNHSSGNAHLFFFSTVEYYSVFYLFIFSFTFISWRLITLQYCSGFCHTLT